MKDKKFTPGPWRLVKVISSIIPDTVVDKDGDHTIAVTYIQPVNFINQEANAALIAAAPAMYEALEKLTEFIQKKYPWSLSDPIASIMKESEQVLAKARGETVNDIKTEPEYVSSCCSAPLRLDDEVCICKHCKEPTVPIETE